ncbi:3-hydroxybutyryl-CoA dehydrogenase [Nitrospira defluvii]|nr:3-hydroxybutyryl-CoA dehydrogenase [Nitrospira defluvii]
MDFNIVGIAGAGQMGSGIAQLVASAGPDVILYDLEHRIVEKALEQITQRLNKAVEKKKLTDWVRDKTLKNIKISTRFEELGQSDIIIEATPEKEEIKIELFEELEEICAEKTIFATNTSSLPVTRMASALSQPNRFIGLHFMNPVPIMPLVEIIRAWQTSDETFEAAKQFIQKLGKTIVVSKDYPGFIVNRILMPMINEAVFVLTEGVASAEEIDTAIRLGGSHPMGPLALADMIGLDICLDIMEILYAEFSDSKYRPAPLLRKYVEADWLGKKSGRGFYEYGNEST